MVRAARPAPLLRRARLAVIGAFFVQGLTAGSLLGRVPALQERYSLNATAVTALIACGVPKVCWACELRRYAMVSP